MYERVDVANLLCDTCEVLFGPILGELLATQLSDTLMHQPELRLEDAELIITSVNSYQRLITWDAASGGDEANSNIFIWCITTGFTGSAASVRLSIQIDH